MRVELSWFLLRSLCSTLAVGGISLVGCPLGMAWLLTSVLDDVGGASVCIWVPHHVKSFLLDIDDTVC